MREKIKKIINWLFMSETEAIMRMYLKKIREKTINQ